jgi:hypothetical protein
MIEHQAVLKTFDKSIRWYEDALEDTSSSGYPRLHSATDGISRLR